MAVDLPNKNEDREIWREAEGDYYSPSIHVTKHGGIGINVGGRVIALPVRVWHSLAKQNAELLNTVLMESKDGR